MIEKESKRSHISLYQLYQNPMCKVILSAAKDLSHEKRLCQYAAEILRCAQDDC